MGIRSRLAGAAVAALLLVLAAAAPAAAQRDSVLAVGVAASVYHPSDEALESPWGVGLIMRLRRHSGFGATIGLGWFKTDVSGDIAGERTRLGTLLVRPLMVGVTYTRQYAKFSLAGSLLAGRAFNGLRHTGDADDAYASIGQPGTSIDITDGFAWRTGFSIWWDLGSRFGLLTSIAYFSAHPEIVTTTPTAGTFRRPVDMSSPVFTVGIGYGIF